jgi:hypothetical protein
MRPNNELLSVFRARPSNAGQYTCTLASSDGTIVSAVVNLRIRRKLKTN